MKDQTIAIGCLVLLISVVGAGLVLLWQIGILPVIIAFFLVSLFVPISLLAFIGIVTSIYWSVSERVSIGWFIALAIIISWILYVLAGYFFARTGIENILRIFQGG